MSRMRNHRSGRRTSAPIINKPVVNEDTMATYENNEMPRALAEEYTGWLVGTMEYVAKAAGAAWEYVVSAWQTSLFFCAIGGTALAAYFVMAGMVAPILIVIQAIVSTIELFLYTGILTYVAAFTWYMLPESVRGYIGLGAEAVASAAVAVFMAPVRVFNWAWDKVSSWFGPSDEARDEKALNAAATLRAVG